MQSKIIITLLIALLTASNGALFAEGVEEHYNMSAEYIRTLNRTATADSADAAFYNPAGIVKLKDGLHINVSNQSLILDFSQDVEGTRYKSNTAVKSFPTAFAVYKQDNWGGYFSFTIPGGGGVMNYTRGNETTNFIYKNIAYHELFYGIEADKKFGDDPGKPIMSFTGLSYYPTITLGGAYAINKMFSFSLGYRLVYALNQSKISVNWLQYDSSVPGRATDISVLFDIQETAITHSAVLGANISPTDNINIGLKYEMRSPLELETKVNQKYIKVAGADVTELAEQNAPGMLPADGKKRRRDIPSLIAAGFSYMITPELRTEVDLICYLNKYSTLDDGTGYKQNFRNSYDSGFTLEYAVTKTLKASLGFLYVRIQAKQADYGLSENPSLDGYGISGGIRYEPIKDLLINIGLLKSFFIEAMNSKNTTLNKDVWDAGLSVEYRFL
jgi:long-chain fatty acid transport protein